MQDAIDRIEKKIKFENVCCVFPCSPFLKTKNLKKALKYIKNNKNCVVLPVSKFRCPPEKSLIMKKNNQLKALNTSATKINNNCIIESCRKKASHNFIYISY